MAGVYITAKLYAAVFRRRNHIPHISRKLASYHQVRVFRGQIHIANRMDAIIFVRQVKIKPQETITTGFRDHVVPGINITKKTDIAVFTFSNNIVAGDYIFVHFYEARIV